MKWIGTCLGVAATVLLLPAGYAAGTLAVEPAVGSGADSPAAEEREGAAYQHPAPGRMADPVDAEHWYLDAAIRGDAKAWANLGRLYLTGGGGVERHFGKARYWLTKAALAGIPQAQFDLGVIYTEGLGTGADWPLARRWLETAVRNGNREAQRYLQSHAPGCPPASSRIRGCTVSDKSNLHPEPAAGAAHD